MATIITVHGTFASAESDEGDRWWQKGSEFERDVRERVEGEDGTLHFRPHVWDGYNSELSRRYAGEPLLAAISPLEEAKTHYCLIGHSHGGSVIAGTIVRAFKGRKPLRYLSRWLTVGTPFIETIEHRGLFQRLRGGWQIFYTGFALFSVIQLLTVISDLRFEQSIPPGDIAVLAAANLFIAVFLYLEAEETSSWRWYTAATFEQMKHEQWVCLRHSDDEAVQGLTALPKITFPIKVPFPIFDAKFLVNSLMTWSALAIPTVLLLIVLLASLLALHNSFLSVIYGEIGTLPVSQQGRFALLSAFYLSASLSFGIVSMCFLRLLRKWLENLSAFTADILNRITWSQIRRSTFGIDATGEIGSRASDRPPGLISSLPLPMELSREISDFADKAAAQSVSKFRRAVQLLAFSEERKGKSDVLADYLTWDELIHTAYFKVPRFRKLVCYAIAHSPGFRPTEKFKGDPDYALVGTWYEQVQLRQPLSP